MEENTNSFWSNKHWRKYFCSKWFTHVVFIPALQIFFILKDWNVKLILIEGFGKASKKKWYLKWSRWSKEIFEVVKAGLDILEEGNSPGTHTKPWQLIKERRTFGRTRVSCRKGWRRKEKQVGESQLGQVSFVLDASSSKPVKKGELCQKYQWEMMRVRTAKRKRCETFWR